MFGLILGQLVIAVLGALTITSEYSTGMIRTSLTVMPRRGTVFAAKAVVFTARRAGHRAGDRSARYFIGQAILATQHINSTIGQPGVLRAVIGGGLFLAVCGLLSYGIGALLRHTAGAITASIGAAVRAVRAERLPAEQLGGARRQVDPVQRRRRDLGEPERANMFSPWTGFGVFCAYAAVALIGGRDPVPHQGRVTRGARARDA